MNKAEFQKLHGFDDETMGRIDYVLTLTKGKIVYIEDNKEWQKNKEKYLTSL